MRLLGNTPMLGTDTQERRPPLKRLKKNLLERSEGICEICFNTRVTLPLSLTPGPGESRIDCSHIVAGRSNATNEKRCVAAHPQCNQDQGRRPLKDYLRMIGTYQKFIDHLRETGHSAERFLSGNIIIKERVKTDKPKHRRRKRDSFSLF